MQSASPQPPTPPTEKTPPEPTPAELTGRAQVRGRIRILVLLSLTGLICSMFSTRSYGWVLLILGAVALLTAVGFAISLYPALARAKAPAFGHVVASVVLLMNLLFAFNMTLTAALWPMTQDYRDCVENSVTLSSQASCQKVLEDSLLGGFGLDGLNR